MQPNIISLAPKKLAGICQTMSLANNLTGKLWGRFMPLRKGISPLTSPDLYSLQVYPPGYFQDFSPATPFEKWALVELAGETRLPEGVGRFDLEGGLYAVFHYKGSHQDSSIFQYIYLEWLPRSGYHLDDRPHFELLGPLYKNGDPHSEEDIYIPIIKVSDM